MRTVLKIVIVVLAVTLMMLTSSGCRPDPTPTLTPTVDPYPPPTDPVQPKPTLTPTPVVTPVPQPDTRLVIVKKAESYKCIVSYNDAGKPIMDSCAVGWKSQIGDIYQVLVEPVQADGGLLYWKLYKGANDYVFLLGEHTRKDYTRLYQPLLEDNTLLSKGDIVMSDLWLTLLMLVVIPLVQQIIKLYVDKTGEPLSKVANQAIAFGLAIVYTVLTGGFAGFPFPALPSWSGDLILFIADVGVFLGGIGLLWGSAWAIVSGSYELIWDKLFVKYRLATKDKLA